MDHQEVKRVAGDESTTPQVIAHVEAEPPQLVDHPHYDIEKAGASTRASVSGVKGDVATSSPVGVRPQEVHDDAPAEAGMKDSQDGSHSPHSPVQEEGQATVSAT